MIRLVLFLLGVLAIAAGLSWLADRPGSLLITWQDYVVETSVFRAVVIFTALIGLTLLAWSIVRQLWSSPAAVSHFLTKRRQRRGLDALSSGMIAIGAGDRSMATRYALQARKSLPNEPLTHLLRAQAAQLSGDKATARRIFEAMLGSPDTEQLGLRGLYLEAAREGETEAQRQFAERALSLNPKLVWPIDGLFQLQCRAGDWAGALETLAAGRRNGQIEKPLADRRRAVLLTAQAQALEEDKPDQALTLALEAHGLAPTLVPAAAIAGRLLASKGNTQRAAKVILKTWASAPHPELATAYAYARIGDSPLDRLERVKQLSTMAPHSVESWIAVAVAAIEAHDYGEARRALEPFIDGRLTRRIAALLARIDAEESGDKGRAREWLARAATAPRDAAWTADGVVSDRWAPISPVSGKLDAFEWRVPVEETEASSGLAGSDVLEDLIAAQAAGGAVMAQTPIGDDVIIAKAEPVGEAAPRKPEPEPQPTAKPEARAEAPAEKPAEVTATKPAPRKTPKTPPKTEIYKAPHAPDDPGPDGDGVVADPEPAPRHMASKG